MNKITNEISKEVMVTLFEEGIDFKTKPASWGTYFEFTTEWDNELDNDLYDVRLAITEDRKGRLQFDYSVIDLQTNSFTLDKEIEFAKEDFPKIKKIILDLVVEYR